jgi:hypothetical protein
MTSLDDREKAQENKHAHEEELRFKARARAAKLFGRWVAEKIGLPPDAYASEFIGLVTSGKFPDDLIKKAANDAKAKGADLSEDLLGEKLTRCLSEAKEQLHNG